MPVSQHDALIRIARQRGESVSSVARELLSKSLRKGAF
jgi:hypothetical protein